MFNDRLRSTRMAREFTQQQMADILHMGLRNYQKYESNDASPTLDGLVKIADILNVPTDFLLARDDYLSSIGLSVDIPLNCHPRHPGSKKKL